MADADPAAADLREGIIDLRPGWDEGELDRVVEPEATFLVSGADDLIELRRVVERMTGVATWPSCDIGEGFVAVESRRTIIELPRPAAALGLVMAMSDLIEDRSRAWRTWPTVVESVGLALGSTSTLTVETQVIRRR